MATKEIILGQCLQAQVEELEVLCAIYGDDWQCDDSDRSYHIVLKEGAVEVTLFMHLPDTYPQESPPVYTLSAPLLSREHKNFLISQIEQVYLENVGQTVLFQWIEKIKECLLSLSTEQNVQIVGENATDQEETGSQQVVFELPVIIHGDTISDRKSTFQGHTATVHSVEQAKQVLEALKANKKIGNATHKMYAYRIAKEDSTSFIQDCEDDGETQAGSRLLHLLQILNVTNTLVIVSRWYGGIHLGSDRFRHINNAARQVLLQAGAINSDTKKKKN